MTAEMMTDEPLIRPASAGSALVRLLQVQGAIRRQETATGASIYPLQELENAYSGLLSTLQNNDWKSTAAALQIAQDRIAEVYAALVQSDNRDAAIWDAFGFPFPGTGLSAINIDSVLVTYAKPKKQVITSIAFDDAGGATGYWLHEITDLPNDEEVQDALVSSKTPLFPRVRLPIGCHRLLIESRNADENTLSAEFVIEVPDL